jgi:hypothetical protein
VSIRVVQALVQVRRLVGAGELHELHVVETGKRTNFMWWKLGIGLTSCGGKWE